MFPRGLFKGAGICCHCVQEDVKDVVREVEVLNLVSDHPNVAELVATFEDTHYVHLVCRPNPISCHQCH